MYMMFLAAKRSFATYTSRLGGESCGKGYQDSNDI